MGSPFRTMPFRDPHPKDLYVLVVLGAEHQALYPDVLHPEEETAAGENLSVGLVVDEEGDA